MRENKEFPDPNTENRIKQLPKILQVILSTEGTVTDILSTWIGGDVTIEKLMEKDEISYVNGDADENDFEVHSLLDERTILVRDNDNRPLVKAVSAVYLENLPPYLKQKLRETDIGIGRLLRTEKIPTHREIKKIEFLPISKTENFSKYFPDEKSSVIHRSYDIFIGVKLSNKILTVNEYWPASIKF